MTTSIVIVAVVALLVLVVAASTVRMAMRPAALALRYMRTLLDMLNMHGSITRRLWERLRGWLPTPQDRGPDARPLPTPWRRAPDPRHGEAPSNRPRGAPV